MTVRRGGVVGYRDSEAAGQGQGQGQVDVHDEEDDGDAARDAGRDLDDGPASPGP